MKASTQRSAGKDKGTRPYVGKSSSHISRASAAYRAAGHVRVTTTTRSSEGGSLEGQRAAIRSYCTEHGISVIRVCCDVDSGLKGQRTGFQDALGCLEREADALIVVTIDRLTRSTRQFCDLHARYFQNDTKSLVVIRQPSLFFSSSGQELLKGLLGSSGVEGLS